MDGNKWNKEDPLAQDDYNQNLLAWFGFEETLRNIGYNFETLQAYSKKLVFARGGANGGKNAPPCAEGELTL